MSASIQAGGVSVTELFWQADAVVKGVMTLLGFASVWVWGVAFDTWLRLRRAQRSLLALEQVNAGDWPVLSARPRGPAQRVLAKAWRAAVQDAPAAESLSRSERRERFDDAARTQLGRELRAMDRLLPSLATISASAPFIGLFGTVWGIMNSFSAIAVSRDTSLAAVAPGIAEALLATAAGLVAAIPAVIVYNTLANAVGRFSSRTQAAMAEIGAVATRDAGLCAEG